MCFRTLVYRKTKFIYLCEKSPQSLYKYFRKKNIFMSYTIYDLYDIYVLYYIMLVGVETNVLEFVYYLCLVYLNLWISKRLRFRFCWNTYTETPTLTISSCNWLNLNVNCWWNVITMSLQPVYCKGVFIRQWHFRPLGSVGFWWIKAILPVCLVCDGNRSHTFWCSDLYGDMDLKPASHGQVHLHCCTIRLLAVIPIRWYLIQLFLNNCWKLNNNCITVTITTVKWNKRR